MTIKYTLKVDSPHEVLIGVVALLETKRKKEIDLKEFETLVKDKQARQARVNLLSEIINDLNNTIIQTEPL